MLYPKNRNVHRPLHIYKDNAFYFITARTVNKARFFNSNEKKKVLFLILKNTLKKYDYQLFAWAVLDNHYHNIIKTKIGENLKFFIKDFHSLCSKELNKLENQKGRRIWFQYWDYCIRNEKDFFLHFNYIHHNPVKHKYVGSQQKCCDYRFCSYKIWTEKKGQEWINDCFEKYSIRDFTVEEDNF